MAEKTAKDMRLNIRLGADLFKQLKQTARDAHTSVSNLVREGIELAIHSKGNGKKNKQVDIR